MKELDLLPPKFVKRTEQFNLQQSIRVKHKLSSSTKELP